MDKCKNCNLSKQKTPVTKGNITRFVDENNKVWNGKQCPDCYKEYNRNRMRLSRQKQNVNEPLKLE
jgi:hypothetical protein